MVQEPVPIEHDPFDALLLTAPRDQQPDLLGRADIGRLLEPGAQIGRQRGDGKQRLR